MPGQTGVKRNPTERARDRRLIAHLYLNERISQVEIAERMNGRDDVSYTLSQQTISNDLAALREAWVKAGVRDLDEARADELGRIDLLETEYWRAWTESSSSRVRVSKERRVGSDVVSNRQEVERPSGDPRFLRGIERCIERRCKLLGLDAPIKNEHDLAPDLKEDVKGKLAQLLDRLAPEAAENGADQPTE